MRQYSKPVAPKHLGIIGSAHFKTRFKAAGGALDTFKYQLRKGIGSNGIPYVIEFKLTSRPSDSCQRVDQGAPIDARPPLC
jgi:hypothetical protein